MAKDIDWMIVRESDKEIGAIGFIGNKVAVIAAFYDDKDGNEDGQVSVLEWISYKVWPLSMEGYQVTKVAMAVRFDLSVMGRDSSFQSVPEQLFIEFSKELVIDGVYTAYFSAGVSRVASTVAGLVTENLVYQYIIRKGMEKSVRELYDASYK